MAKKKKHYRWKPGSRLRSKLDAQACGERIEELGGTTVVTPEQILADARLSTSPLHGGFDWSDSSAAEKFRLWQARDLLGNIVVEVVIEQKAVGVILRPP